jgi:hypothetical protein
VGRSIREASNGELQLGSIKCHLLRRYEVEANIRVGAREVEAGALSSGPSEVSTVLQCGDPEDELATTKLQRVGRSKLLGGDDASKIRELLIFTCTSPPQRR